jgi:hypothetical protein
MTSTTGVMAYSLGIPPPGCRASSDFEARCLVADAVA